jgi:hypothetical protein
MTYMIMAIDGSEIGATPTAQSRDLPTEGPMGLKSLVTGSDVGLWRRERKYSGIFPADTGNGDPGTTQDEAPKNCARRGISDPVWLRQDSVAGGSS